MHLKRGHKVHKETQRSQRAALFLVFVVVLRGKYNNIGLT